MLICRAPDERHESPIPLITVLKRQGIMLGRKIPFSLQEQGPLMIDVCVTLICPLIERGFAGPEK